MATINGYTAERMKQIEDNSIVDGDVVGNDLILKKYNGVTKNAGNVRGPAGIPGDEDVDAKVADALNMADPPGTPKPYTGATAPSGHGLCDAATEFSSGTYPILAGLYGTGAACINGASTAGTFRLPNLKGRILVGRDAAIPAFDTLHELGGSKDAVTVSHSHSHGHNHSHSGSWIGDGGADHTHSVLAGGTHDHTNVEGPNFAVSVGGPQNHRLAESSNTTETGPYITYDSVDEAGEHTHGTSAASSWIHGHALNLAADAALDATVSGVSGVDANLPPYRIINWIMRLA